MAETSPARSCYTLDNTGSEDPDLEEESGDTAGPPSAPREGDRLEPDPVEPGEVVGTPVNCNEEK